MLNAVRTPQSLLTMVWPLPRSLATTSGISVDFFSSPYLDVSVQAVPLIHLWIQCMMYELHSYGLLHSDIFGSMCACHSPKLFAAYRVLHRLLMPRHPPCALISLNSLRRIMSCSHSFKNLFLLGEVIEIVNFPYFLKHWIFLNFLFVVSLFNFQRSLSIRRHLKSLDDILVEIKGIEPLTPCLQSRCSPS